MHIARLKKQKKRWSCRYTYTKDCMCHVHCAYVRSSLQMWVLRSFFFFFFFKWRLIFITLIKLRWIIIIEYYCFFFFSITYATHHLHNIRRWSMAFCMPYASHSHTIISDFEIGFSHLPKKKQHAICLCSHRIFRDESYTHKKQNTKKTRRGVSAGISFTDTSILATKYFVPMWIKAINISSLFFSVDQIAIQFLSG